MTYCRIKLSKTNYQAYDYAYIDDKPNLKQLQKIYKQYCEHKKFKSVMPLFENDLKVDKIMAYYHEGEFVAFTRLFELDKHNIESVQFAWNYEKPKLRLGIVSLENECAWAKANGYRYLYLGRDDAYNNPNNYKTKFKGFEVLGAL